MREALSDFGNVQRLELSPVDGGVAVSASGVSMKHFETLKPRAAEFLSPRELEYFLQRPFARKQKSFLLGRLAAKIALSNYLGGYSPPELDIYPGVFEQPLVRCGAPIMPGISISHCEDVAMALAFPLTHPMGIDVELIDADMVETMKSQMCPGEQAWAKGGEPLRCALIWTAKEALSKALKCGMTTPFALLEVENLKATGPGWWQGEYRNFKQYHCCSWLAERHAISIALPIQVSVSPTTDLRLLMG